MTAVAERDLHDVLDVLDAAERAQPVPERFASEVLASLAVLVECDVLAYADLDVATCTHFVNDDHEGSVTSYLREPSVEPDHPFWRHYARTPSCSYPTRTGDHRTVTMRSDFCSDLEWRESPMYVDHLGADGIMHDLMCPLPSVGTRSRRLLFFRGPGPDFTDRDRDVLVLLRPHLADVLRRSSARAGAADLTPRQRELMQLVAAGRSNTEIARQLVVSPHTVRKHLENVFERLGVSSRTEAVARCFS
jgi:DNA-binding CsgD family transcriptional regulator